MLFYQMLLLQILMFGLPFTAKKEGLLKWLGSTSINVEDNTISSLDDLLNIAKSNDTLQNKKKYILVNNLDLSSIKTGNAIFEKDFSGILEGNGHTISNLNIPLFNNLKGTVNNLNIVNSKIINSSGKNIAPLAKTSNGATIFNVNLENIEIEGNDNVSAFIGYTESTKINNIQITNFNIKGNRYYIGGLIGRAFNTNVSNVLLDGNITLYATHNGGVIGAINNGSLENAVSKVNITRPRNTDSRNQNGGIIGSIEKGSPVIKNCIALGNVSEDVYKTIGGINSYNAGDIYGARTFVKNVYELDSSTGKTNVTTDNIVKSVTSEKINTTEFYQNELGLNLEIWNISGVESGKIPTLNFTKTDN